MSGGAVIMTRAQCSYVIVGLKRERCRAKNPNKCRYHVGANGKPLKHYSSAWAADKALGKLMDTLDNTPRGVEPCDDEDMLDMESLIDDSGDGDECAETEPAPNHAGRVDVNDDSIGLDEPSLSSSKTNGVDATMLSPMNSMRARACMSKASNQVAANVVLMTMRELKKHGELRMELMWGYPDSPALWPELWSTRLNERDSVRDGVEPMERRYLDPSSATESWSFDFINDDDRFDTKLMTCEAGVYDAVRDGFLKWEDLKMAGATSCLLTATEYTSDDFLRTVNAWCGRKPRRGIYVQGDEDINRGHAFRGLAEMMRAFEMMASGMNQAEVTLSIMGSPVK